MKYSLKATVRVVKQVLKKLNSGQVFIVFHERFANALICITSIWPSFGLKGPRKRGNIVAETLLFP